MREASAGTRTWTLRGERILLLPGRAALRPATGELLVADVHLGKTEAFRRAGQRLPTGTTTVGLARIDALIDRFAPERLTVLGDLTHHELDVEGGTLSRLGAWLTRRADLRPRLVLGNHDRHAREALASLDIELCPEPIVAEGIRYLHHPAARGATEPWIAGHVHPGHRLRIETDRIDTPVFWAVGGSGLVLPAFGEFTGIFRIEDDGLQPEDRTFAAGDESVVALPNLAATSRRRRRD